MRPLKTLRSRAQIQTPIATDMFLPNHSGVQSHPDLLALLKEIVPIGAIFPWNKSKPGTPALSAYWQECDGSEITDTDSPYVGLNTPNLNGGSGQPNTNRFIRGASTSGGTGGSDTHTHTFTGSEVSTSTVVGQGANNAASGTAFQGQHTHTVTAVGTNAISDSRPEYFDMVFIMRIK